jgi:hypothetical protein
MKRSKILARWMPLLNLASVLACGLQLWTDFAYSQTVNQVVWDGVLELDVFDCGREGVGKIVVSGEVVLVHPADVGNAGIQSIKSIRISCPNLEFLTASRLSSKSSLDIRISDVSSGPIWIENTRGRRGDDAPAVPEALLVRKMPKGSDGRRGNDGADASCDPFRNFSAEDGQSGGAGADGEPGVAGIDEPLSFPTSQHCRQAQQDCKQSTIQVK